MSPKKKNIALSNWELVSVNPNNKNWGWKDLFCFWSVGTQSIISFTLITSLYLIFDLNFYEVFIGTIIASLLVFLFSNLLGSPSQKHGIPFPVFLRISAGYEGAKYLSILRGVVGIFFFGVQTFFISKSISYLIRIILLNLESYFLDKEIFFNYVINLDIIDWTALFLTLLFQYIFFSKGQKLIRKFINFSAMFVYFGLFFFFIIFVAETEYYLFDTLIDRLNFSNGFNNFKFINSLGVAGTMFAYYSILIISFGDFSRYVEDKRELYKGNISLIGASVLFSFFALFLVTGSDVYFKSSSIEVETLITNPTDIIRIIDNTYLTVTVLIFILFASLSTNLIANYIPSQNAILNFLPNKMSLKSSGLVIIILGFFVGIFWTSFFSQNGSMSIVDTITCLFGPIFGVIATDYYIIRNKVIINKDIFFATKNSSYMYKNGWNYKAVYSILVGTIFALSTIWNPNLQIFEAFSFLIGLIVSSTIYYLLSNN